MRNLQKSFASPLLSIARVNNNVRTFIRLERRILRVLTNYRTRALLYTRENRLCDESTPVRLQTGTNTA